MNRVCNFIRATFSSWRSAKTFCRIICVSSRGLSILRTCRWTFPASFCNRVAKWKKSARRWKKIFWNNFPKCCRMTGRSTKLSGTSSASRWKSECTAICSTRKLKTTWKTFCFSPRRRRKNFRRLPSTSNVCRKVRRKFIAPSEKMRRQFHKFRKWKFCATEGSK